MLRDAGFENLDVERVHAFCRCATVASPNVGCAKSGDIAVPQKHYWKADVRTVKSIPRLRKYALAIIGFLFILLAVCVFVADRAGVYQLSNGLTVWSFVLVGSIFIIAYTAKRHLYIGVGGAIVLAFAVGIVIGGLIFEPKEWPPVPVSYDEYCLVTWEEPSGNVCFKLMFNFEASRAIHSPTAKSGGRCGISELKQTLSSMPAGSHVYWYTWPSKFDYPTSVNTDELIAFAKSKEVNLQLTPALR